MISRQRVKTALPLKRFVFDGGRVSVCDSGGGGDQHSGIDQHRMEGSWTHRNLTQPDVNLDRHLIQSG